MLKSNYTRASIRRRVAAKILDLGVGVALIDVSAVLIDGYRLHPSLVLLSMLAAVAYWLLGDSMGGQSVGKRILGIKVVDYKHGSPCTPLQSLIRNFVGLGWLRVWQIAEEEEALESGRFNGQIVIDVRPHTQGNRPPPLSQQNVEVRSKLDLEGIGRFVRDRKIKENIKHES